MHNRLRRTALGAVLLTLAGSTCGAGHESDRSAGVSSGGAARCAAHSGGRERRGGRGLVRRPRVARRPRPPSHRAQGERSLVAFWGQRSLFFEEENCAGTAFLYPPQLGSGITGFRHSASGEIWARDPGSVARSVGRKSVIHWAGGCSSFGGDTVEVWVVEAVPIPGFEHLISPFRHMTRRVRGSTDSDGARPLFAAR